MDALEEIDHKIEELVLICERERARILDELAGEAAPAGWIPAVREHIADLALDYAKWTSHLNGYRGLLHRARKPVVLEK